MGERLRRMSARDVERLPRVLPDGTTVTVLTHEGDETFELKATQEAELLAAIAESEEGELISASHVLQQIRH